MTSSPPDTRHGADQPTPVPPRYLAPDLARGFMLLLIAMAYAPFYVSAAEYGLNYHPDDGSTADAVTNLLRIVLLDNRSYTMFAALFGYGLATVVARRQAAGAAPVETRRVLRRRGLFLLLFGFVHGTLVFPGEILGAYGIATLLVASLLFRPDRALLRVVGMLIPVFLLVVPVLTLIASSAMYAEGATVVPGYSPPELLERLVTYPVTPVYNLLTYPVVLTMLLGVWAGRRAVLADPAAHRGLLRRTAVIGIAVSVAGALPAGLVAAGLWQSSTTLDGVLMTVQILTGVAGGLGYAAVFGLISARAGDRPGPIARALAAAGSRSLSCYLFNSVLLALLLSPSLLGLGDSMNSTGALFAAAGVWAVGVTLAVLLGRSGRGGPADVLLRRLVNGPARGR
ncbi:putative membrane protein YeiB [Actinoalloteichus hoggarensis]|uniref:Uncharacterized protein n=1 Tax=Actinoalloteichus hoggarensis TaxID=1470176 RepID=A0A221WB07_9PSEU|nr:DUF418 domain-containing protein [Actinoalloteichus hoggarensis]ASO23055.1 hypothetical protein AHOG_27285 [Actinoalloteichus hoggarensis]MBB5922660.1 putative membrane protein YeiB [Actinoalloteichus hoggarensis]